MSVKIAISTGSRATHHTWDEVPNGGRADLLHRGVELDAHQLEHALDAGLTEGAEAPHVRAPDADRVRAQAERLDDVGAAPETRVNQDRHASAHGLGDFGQCVD